MGDPCRDADRRPRRIAGYRSSWLVCSVVSWPSMWLLSEIVCSRACTPETCAPFFGPFSQPLELAAVLVREGGGARQPQLDQVLVEEVLVLSIPVCIQVDVGQRSPVGVLRVADAGDLQSDDALCEDPLRVVGCPLSEAADGLVRSHSFGGVYAYESHRGAPSPYLHRDGVSVGHPRYSAVELVVSTEAVDQAVKAQPGDRIEDQGEDEDNGHEHPLGEYAVF